MQALHVLVPQTLPVRPAVKGRPFTTDIVGTLALPWSIDKLTHAIPEC